MKEDFTDFIEVSGLLNYDPDTISKIYKKNPKRLLKRLWQTLIPIFAYIFSVGWDKLTGRLKNVQHVFDYLVFFFFIPKQFYFFIH